MTIEEFCKKNQFVQTIDSSLDIIKNQYFKNIGSVRIEISFLGSGSERAIGDTIYYKECGRTQMYSNVLNSFDHIEEYLGLLESVDNKTCKCGMEE